MKTAAGHIAILVFAIALATGLAFVLVEVMHNHLSHVMAALAGV